MRAGGEISENFRLCGIAEEVGHDHVRTKSGRVAPYITLYKM